jgi:hypothetical protein
VVGTPATVVTTVLSTGRSTTDVTTFSITCGGRVAKYAATPPAAATATPAPIATFAAVLRALLLLTRLSNFMRKIILNGVYKYFAYNF